MPVRSKRFSGPVAITAGSTVTVLSVAAGRTAVVHALMVYCSTAGRIFINVNGATCAVRDLTANTDADLIRNGTWDFNPGDLVQAISSGGFVGNITAFGSLLLGAPT